MNKVSKQFEILQAFADANDTGGKGALAMLLVVTRKLSKANFPVDSETMFTDSGGQISGVSGNAANKVLKAHGIDARLADEGGRTNRGNTGKFRAYVACLNSLHSKSQLNLEEAEKFWVERTVDFLASEPFKLKQDRSLSMKGLLEDVLNQARKRQAQRKGATILGTVMQHMIAAKFRCLLGEDAPIPHKASEADSSRIALGDFEVGDLVVHVTSSPSEALLEKCRNNLSMGKSPVIVTLPDSLTHTKSLSLQAGIETRIEVWSFEQFIATNVHEWGKFTTTGARREAHRLIENYNNIISELGEQSSFRIEI